MLITIIKLKIFRPLHFKFYNRYKHGKGSELEPQGSFPPKMASVASSSRFCYLALRDGIQGIVTRDNVNVEHPCRINGIKGTAPQLDAYASDINTYFEVKCHEIFDSHTVKMSSSYWNLIYGENNDFGFLADRVSNIDCFDIPLSEFGIESDKSMFDIKQLLCHLLGISFQNDVSENKRLVYLFFKPKTKSAEDMSAINEVFELLQTEIDKIFNSRPIKNFTSKHKISLMAVAEFAEVMEPITNANTVILAQV